jgi:hypothetical protein
VFRLYLTRLVLPIVFVVLMISIPFIWFPEMGSRPKTTPAAMVAGQSTTPQSKSAPRNQTPLQRVMVLGFMLILISITVGGVMLYGITRRQTLSFGRRFAPKEGKKKKTDDTPSS